MSILRDKRPSVHSLLGCKLPRPRRTFGIGLVDFPDGPYDDEPPTLPESLWHEPETDGGDFWSEELEHLESLLPHATPARRAEIDRRIDAVLAMMSPRLEAERLQAESLERQLAASWALDQIEAGAERCDGRYTDEDAFNMGACG